jgi:hypothetical protein
MDADYSTESVRNAVYLKTGDEMEINKLASRILHRNYPHVYKSVDKCTSNEKDVRAIKGRLKARMAYNSIILCLKNLAILEDEIVFEETKGDKINVKNEFHKVTEGSETEKICSKV